MTKTKERRGGKRPGAGRPKKAAVTLSLDDGLMPIDFLVGTMRGLQFVKGKWIADKKITRGMKTDAAKAAAPYLYPKLSNVDSNLAIDASFTVKVVKYSND